jgi:hypothetical protein
MKFEVLRAVKMSVLVFCVEHTASTFGLFFRNVGIYLLRPYSVKTQKNKIDN